MSARAVIDSLEFARSGGEIRGEVPLTELGRLADSLHDRDGQLRFALAGLMDGRQRPRLQLKVVGTLNLSCQRCLGSLQHAVEQEASLLLLEAGVAGESAGVDDLDAVAADAELDVWSLVEDEVLLALPIAPRHAEGACRAAGESVLKQRASPFAVLAGLKGKQVN
jgi:uncharacterized protein